MSMSTSTCGSSYDVIFVLSAMASLASFNFWCHKAMFYYSRMQLCGNDDRGIFDNCLLSWFLMLRCVAWSDLSFIRQTRTFCQRSLLIHDPFCYKRNENVKKMLYMSGSRSDLLSFFTGFALAYEWSLILFKGSPGATIDIVRPIGHHVLAQLKWITCTALT